MLKFYQIPHWYVKAMQFANKKYGPAKWSKVQEEVQEFRENPSFEEFWDILHAYIRTSGSTWFGLIIWPCAVKMARRFFTYGDIASERIMKERGIDVPAIH